MEEEIACLCPSVGMGAKKGSGIRQIADPGVGDTTSASSPPPTPSPASGRAKGALPVSLTWKSMQSTRQWIPS